MWDDEPSPWDDDSAATDEAAAEEAAAAPAAAAAATPDAPWDWRKANLPKAPLPKYTLHWVKPLVLNYRYNYDYRRNYYNDVIDWMNKRNKGLYRETPRAQEWAERALRTYDEMNVNKSHKRSADMRDLTSRKPKIHYYSYHTRAYYSLKYQKIL